MTDEADDSCNVIRIRYCGHCGRPVNHTKPHASRMVNTPTGRQEVLFVLCVSGLTPGPKGAAA